MRLLWVATAQPVSRLIRWALNSECSHFAVSFDEDASGRGIAFHSYSGGTELVWLRDFLRKYKVVHALTPKKPLALADEERVYKAILDTEAGLGYDWPAMAWWAWRATLKKTAGVPIGPNNHWQSRGKRLCTGVAPAVLKALAVDLPAVDYEMIPPHELFRRLRDCGAFVEV